MSSQLRSDTQEGTHTRNVSWCWPSSTAEHTLAPRHEPNTHTPPESNCDQAGSRIVPCVCFGKIVFGEGAIQVLVHHLLGHTQLHVWCTQKVRGATPCYGRFQAVHFRRDCLTHEHHNQRWICTWSSAQTAAHLVTYKNKQSFRSNNNGNGTAPTGPPAKQEDLSFGIAGGTIGAHSEGQHKCSERAVGVARTASSIQKAATSGWQRQAC